MNYFEFGPVVKEEMSFKEKVYPQRTKTNHNSSKDKNSLESWI